MNIDLGPDGLTYYRTYELNQLIGEKFNGQHVSLDLTFNKQIHLFANTYPNFLISVSFKTSGGTDFIRGTGYVTDINGQRLIDSSLLGSADTNGVTWVGLFPCYYGITQPTDIYGAHFDLVLPNFNGTIVDSGLELFDNDFVLRGHRVQTFRIGPHIPDSGSTWLLLTIALIPILKKRI